MRILDQIKRDVPAQSFECFLKPTAYAGTVGRILKVFIPSQEFKHIGEKYSTNFTQAIHHLGLEIDEIQCCTFEDLVGATEEGFDAD